MTTPVNRWLPQTPLISLKLVLLCMAYQIFLSYYYSSKALPWNSLSFRSVDLDNWIIFSVKLLLVAASQILGFDALLCHKWWQSEQLLIWENWASKTHFKIPSWALQNYKWVFFMRWLLSTLSTPKLCPSRMLNNWILEKNSESFTNTSLLTVL